MKDIILFGTGKYFNHKYDIINKYHVKYIIDNKITSSEDVEKIFGISVLATIPYNNKQKTKK